MNIPKHVITQKISAFMKVYILWKFQCISQINSSFDDALFFNFDTTLKLFFSPHFSFFLCDKQNVVISKVHYESIIFLEFNQKICDDSQKSLWQHE